MSDDVLKNAKTINRDQSKPKLENTTVFSTNTPAHITNLIEEGKKREKKQQEQEQTVTSQDIKSSDIPIDNSFAKDIPRPTFIPKKVLPTINYPVYTVITPQTKDTYKVRSLTVADMMKLKGSLVTPSDLVKIIAEVLWGAVVEKPNHITDFKTFIRHLTTHDRKALLFGLYHVTEGDITDYPIEACQKCGKSFKANFPIGGMAKITSYPGTDILTKRVTVDLPISKGQAIIKQNTVFDELESVKLAEQLPGKKNTIDEMLFIDKFIFDGTEIFEVIDMLDIYSLLPKKDQKALYDAYYKNFGQYTISVEGEVACPFCGAKTEITIDFMELFFRLVS